MKEIIVDEDSKTIEFISNPETYRMRLLCEKVLSAGLVGIPLYHIDLGKVLKDKVEVYRSVLSTEPRPGIKYGQTITFKASCEVDKITEIK